MSSSARFRFDNGDIYYVAFPFDDKDGAKSRPALVVGKRGEDHIAVAKVTHVIRGLDCEIRLTPNDSNGLKMPSGIRMDSIKALHRSDFISVVGALNSIEMEHVRRRFVEYLKCGGRADQA